MTNTITVMPDGAIVFETETVDAAVAFVNAVRNGTPDRITPAPFSITLTEGPKRARRGRPRKGDTSLSPQLTEVLDHLKASGSGGTTPGVTADLLAIPSATASWRLKRLVEKGHAVKLGRGKFTVAPK